MSHPSKLEGPRLGWPRSNHGWMFAGQGAQRLGMGAGLFDRHAALVERAEACLGWSVRDLCLGDDAARLNETRFTQPALFLVGGLDYLDRLERGELRPRFLLGHSLGELTALFCAGAYDLETGLRLVQRRGELTWGANLGGMAAVLGLSAQQVSARLSDGVVLAADNTPTQVTIAGPRPALSRAIAALEADGVETVLLDIEGAFHSPLMTHVAESFSKFLDTLELGDPLLPVISNVSARPHRAGELREALVAQLTAPVRWRGCVEWLIEQGVEGFVELGGTQILGKMVTQINKEAA